MPGDGDDLEITLWSAKGSMQPFSWEAYKDSAQVYAWHPRDSFEDFSDDLSDDLSDSFGEDDWEALHDILDDIIGEEQESEEDPAVLTTG